MPAESLAELERRFHALATAGGDVGEIDDDFVSTPDLPAEERLRIYRNMYWIRLVDTLAEQFPQLAGALGGPAFAETARAYLRAHPPTSPSLRELGSKLPEFLAGRPEGAELAEIAALEWTELDLFDGPDATPLSLDAVQALDPEALAELPLVLSPTARVVGTRLVYRKDFDVYHRSLEPGEEAALAEVARGTSVGLLCERLGDAQAVFATLARWLADEILIG